MNHSIQTQSESNLFTLSLNVALELYAEIPFSFQLLATFQLHKQPISCQTKDIDKSNEWLIHTIAMQGK